MEKKLLVFIERNPSLLLLLILFLAFLLRFHNIGKYSLAGDEKYSLLVSQFISQEGGNQGNTFFKKNSPYFTNQEFHSPKNLNDFQRAIAHRDNGSGAFYGIILHYWSDIFGVSDTSLRFTSLIFNLLTVFLIYFFVKTHIKSSNLALLSVFLASISPFFISYSQVVRNYALLFLLALWASHLLLLILEKPKSYFLYIVYGVATFASLMTHYSIFVLFLIHGIYIIIFYRKLNIIFSLTLSMVIPALGLWWWFNSEGGKWAFHSINFSAEVYKQMAKTKPDEWLSVSSISNVLKQLWLTFTHSFLIFEPFIQKFIGFKNIIICMTISCFNFLIINNLRDGLLFHLRFKNANGEVILNFIFWAILFFLSQFFYSINRLEFLTFSFVLPLLIFGVKKHLKKADKIYIFILLLTFLPFVFLVLFAFNDGTTMRIIPRYIGFSYSFGIILIALISQILFEEKYIIRNFLLASGIAIVIFIGINLKKIYEDNPPRYFYGFSEPRIENPYIVSAKKVVDLHAKGDTLIHPSETFIVSKDAFDMPPYSVQDAQYFNIYLPKTPEIIQRCNPNEPNKIILKKLDGKMIEIFDFQGAKYRY